MPHYYYYNDEWNWGAEELIHREANIVKKWLEWKLGEGIAEYMINQCAADNNAAKAIWNLIFESLESWGFNKECFVSNKGVKITDSNEVDEINEDFPRLNLIDSVQPADEESDIGVQSDAGGNQELIQFSTSEEVISYINEGNDINKVDSKGNSILLAEIMKVPCDPEIVSILIESNANIDYIHHILPAFEQWEKSSSKPNVYNYLIEMKSVNRNSKVHKQLLKIEEMSAKFYNSQEDLNPLGDSSVLEDEVSSE